MCVLGRPAAVVVVAVDLHMQLGQLRMVAMLGLFSAATEPVAVVGSADEPAQAVFHAALGTDAQYPVIQMTVGGGLLPVPMLITKLQSEIQGGGLSCSLPVQPKVAHLLAEFGSVAAQMTAPMPDPAA